MLLKPLPEFGKVIRRKKRKKGDFMAIRQKLIDDERDDLTKDVDDLDAAYIQQMKEAGIDENLLQQFADFMKTEKQEADREGNR